MTSFKFSNCCPEERGTEIQLENENGVIRCFITEHTTTWTVLTVFEQSVWHAMFYSIIKHGFEQLEGAIYFILLTICKFLKTNCTKFHIQIERR